MELLLKTFWLFLPAGIANMAPIFFRSLPFLDYPIDFGLKINGKFLLGPNKTYRGLVVGIVFAILFVYIQKLLNPLTMSYSFLDYSEVNVVLLGFLLGAGALFGDLVKSFFKRRSNVSPGKSWIPFDQIDWIVGAIAASSLMIKLSYEIIFTGILLFGLLHLVCNYIGYYIKIKKNKF